MKKRRVVLCEEALQEIIACYLWRCWPGLVWWHTPNGGARSAREGAAFKRMGVVPGVPDICILGNEARMVFVELKTEKGRLQTTQKEFMARAEAQGARCYVVRSLDEMVALMKELKEAGCV